MFTNNNIIGTYCLKLNRKCVFLILIIILLNKDIKTTINRVI